MTSPLPAAVAERLHAELEAVRSVRHNIRACLDAIADTDGNGGAIAAAVAAYLAQLTAAGLPDAVKPFWREQVARRLKADPDKPIPERVIAALRSWPLARGAGLIAALTELEALMADAETDAHNETIYAVISHEYS
jgi:hypothetical protein